MTLAARHVGLLSFLAIVPLGAYGIETGEFTAVIAAMGVLNVLIIATSIVTMFGGESAAVGGLDAIP